MKKKMITMTMMKMTMKIKVDNMIMKIHMTMKMDQKLIESN